MNRMRFARVRFFGHKRFNRTIAVEPSNFLKANFKARPEDCPVDRATGLPPACACPGSRKCVNGFPVTRIGHIAMGPTLRPWPLTLRAFRILQHVLIFILEPPLRKPCEVERAGSGQWPFVNHIGDRA